MKRFFRFWYSLQIIKIVSRERYLLATKKRPGVIIPVNSVIVILYFTSFFHDTISEWPKDIQLPFYPI